ncbi:MAG: AbgT family transporter [Bacteroidales bacterium]|nr:AbgT family transporter [Bacteroidales bacterium]
MFKKIPHTYVIIFSIIILAAVMTWFIPGGEYHRHSQLVNGVERTVIDKGSFHFVDNQPQTWQVFAALFSGFERQAGIIVFILMIGGAFWIVNSSKAIDIGIFSFLRYTENLEHNSFLKKVGVNNIVIVLIMVMFSIFGAVFGMSEETIAFIIILVPLAISMGYDSIVGVSMVFVAAGLGFAGAVLNPFTIGIAQGIADLPLFSGFGYRLFSWFVINLVGISWVLRYARKVKKNPAASPVYHEDDYWREKGAVDEESIQLNTPKTAWMVFGFISIGLLVFSWWYPMTAMKIGNSSSVLPMVPVATGLFVIFGFFSLRKSVHFFILTLLMFTVLFLIIGVMGYAWYIMKIASLFFALGIFSGIAVGYDGNRITKEFLAGASDILSAALVVGLAGGILVVLEDGKIIDTILHGVSTSMAGMGKLGTVSVMYVIQNIINIIIPSGSAKAALTMPVMAPFSDLVNLSRQATVMAFQFGDGFTNMITPTSGVLIGVLGVAKIPYDKWVKWVAPFMLVLIVLGWLLLIPTVTMQLDGF